MKPDMRAGYNPSRCWDFSFWFKTLPARCNMSSIAVQILLMVLSATLAALGYLIQDTRNTLKERQAKQEEATELLAKELADFKAALPRQYVLREDFIRTTATLEAKIDRVATDTTEIKEAIAKLVGGVK